MAKVTNADDLKSGNVACPVTSGSTQSLDLGAEGRVEYKVLCNNTIDSNDRVWGEFPKMDEPFALFYHADSLEECVKWGTKSHPISNAVVYSKFTSTFLNFEHNLLHPYSPLPPTVLTLTTTDPDLKFGYANCIPKANAPQENQRQPSRNEAVMHTAIITSRDNNQTPNATCQNPNTYTSSSTSSRQQFTITCGQDLSPNSPNITLIHTQNITACIDTCAASKDKGCVGVVFDSSLQQGFQNCYLKNSTLVGASLPFATYAVAAGHSAEPTPGNSNSKGEDTDKSDGDGGGSKAWIAGAVVGGLVGLALIGAAIWFLRRRKITPAHASSVGPTQEFYGGSERYAHNAGGSAYMPVQGSSGSYMAELDAGAAQQNELHGVSSSEMKKPRELPA
jgi:hypothetical protein